MAEEDRKEGVVTVGKEAGLSGPEMIELSKRYTMFDWVSQDAASPIPVAAAEGCYFFTPEGKRYLDFNSQLWCSNIGHGDPRVIQAIKDQAEKLAYISPFQTTEARARLGQKLAELLPGDIDKVFFTLGGAEANENAVRMARMVTGRPKIISRYRSYHGATYAMITLTGDPRRWANEPGMPNVIHVLDPYHGPERPVDDAETSLRYLEETIQLEGPGLIAAFILEPVTGTNGILIPPDGYLQGVREICDRYGILMIADEVMTGFGRTGEWFGVNHWDVVPDLLTMAKGLTSSYAPLGAVGMRPKVYEYFQDKVYFGGLTYNSHPLGCAAALAAIRVLEEDGLVERSKKMGVVLGGHHQDMYEKHPSVGLVRNIGLFGTMELVKSRRTMEPLTPFNTVNDTMKAIGKYLLDHGLSTFLRWHSIMTNPPLCITEDELAEGFGIIDGALEIADAAMEE